MEIYYDTKKLKAQCEDPTLRKRNFGRIADPIESRLSELMAAERLSDIPECPPPRRHKMSSQKSVWSLDLTRNYRMWIYGNGEEDPSKVTSVVVLRIVDDH